MNATALSQGLIPLWVASYGTTSDPAFAAIWVANSNNTLWNMDGLLEDAGGYQARFNAQVSAWLRPSFVTLNTDNDYLSVFVADEIGSWVAHHNMTPSDYQTYFNQLTAQGFYPTAVQGGGADASSAHLAAIFVKSQTTTPLAFTASGPVANAAIDAQVEAILKAWPVARQAALAIVHGTKLVYARGYTYAESDWPTVQPTTYFRLASVSKTVTALAIFQLIESGRLALGDTLQSVLNLRTPSGGAPTDPNFAKITIKHLLEHTSGLQPGANSDALQIVQAWKAAGDSSAAFPVTQAMTDAYIASLPLVTTPGAAQAYSNCGYYLLGPWSPCCAMRLPRLTLANQRCSNSSISRAFAERSNLWLHSCRARRDIKLQASEPMHRCRCRLEPASWRRISRSFRPAMETPTGRHHRAGAACRPR
jgi:hypothetical protein